RVDRGELQVVGVNCHKDTGASAPMATLRVSADSERKAAERIRAWRSKRSASGAKAAQTALVDGAKGSGNLQALILSAVKAGCTLGEISDSLRGVFGVHRAHTGF
ncbi:MAG TPA: methylmalonyl-CoA mutase family protein, partial [Bdellovibrionota bacterium]|nr:methylmalonyl-CoA mutase family protein [Bdellovibrionota bacterium]